MVGVDQAKVQPARERRGDHPGRPGRHMRKHRVEEAVVDDPHTAGAKPFGEAYRMVVHPLGDPRQTLRTVVNGIHRGQHGRQHLRRADVAGGLLPADVLLTGLQGQPVGALAVGVHRHADQPARQRPLQAGPHRDETRMRTAETQAQPEPLCAADRDVRPELTRRGQQRERQRIDRRRHDNPVTVRLFNHVARVP